MIVQPPCTVRFQSIKSYEVEAAKNGICPHCTTLSLQDKHHSDGIKFLQCSRCLVVVALAKGV